MQQQVIETTAKTKEDAIEIALKELDADRSEVEIDIVSEGKAGILGLGSEPAKVRVTLLEAPNDLVKVTSEVLDSLLSRLEVSVVVNLVQADNSEVGGPVSCSNKKL